MFYTFLNQVFFKECKAGVLKSRLFIWFLSAFTLQVMAASYPATFVKGIIVTEAVIDGQKVNVILDSGAPGVVLNENYFDTKVGEEIPCAGINGAFSCRTYLINNWAWLGLQQGKTKALVSNLSYLERVAAKPIHAIIGLSVLDDYYVTIDFDQQQVTLQKDIPETLEAAFSRFYYVDHLPVLPCRVNGQKKMLGLDTGSAANYLFQLDAKNTGVQTEDINPVIVVGTGNIEAIKYRIDLSLEFPEGEMPLPTSFIVDLKEKPAFQPAGFDGLLGQEFLQQYNIIIHPGKQKLLLLPRTDISIVMQ